MNLKFIQLHNCSYPLCVQEFENLFTSRRDSTRVTLFTNRGLCFMNFKGQENGNLMVHGKGGGWLQINL